MATACRWLKAEREFLVFKGEAERGERRWRDMGWANQALLAGLDLARAEEWLPKRAEFLSENIRRFITSSISADRANKQQQLRDTQALVTANRRAARRTGIGLITAIILALVAGAFALYAQRQARIADNTTEQALVQSQAAERAKKSCTINQFAISDASSRRECR
jgi:hypothetical protein